MIEPKNIELDGMKFQLQPLPSLKALRLDKKVIELVVPVIGGIKEFSLDAEIDLEAVSKAFSESLGRMRDDEFEKLVADLLSSVLYLPIGGTPQELNPEVINQVFRGKISLIYKLAFQVMRYNKFSPFELVGGGNVISKILSSTEQTKTQKKSGSKLETSAGLLEN